MMSVTERGPLPARNSFLFFFLTMQLDSVVAINLLPTRGNVSGTLGINLVHPCDKEPAEGVCSGQVWRWEKGQFVTFKCNIQIGLIQPVPPSGG